MHLVYHEQLSSEPPKGHVMFYTQILLTLRVKLSLHPWLQRMLSFIGYTPGQLYPGFWDTLIGFYIIWMECGLACIGYAECACRSDRERIVFGKKKTYCTWKNCWCFLYNDWEYAKGVTLEQRVPTHFLTVANIEKVLRVPEEDRHLGKLRPLFQKYGFQPLVSECQRRASKLCLSFRPLFLLQSCIPYFDFSCSMEKVGKKGETNAKKGKALMLVPVDDILFHKGARKHRVRPTPKPKSQKEVLKIAASKKAEAEAIGCAATIVTREERRLLPPLPTINPIFPPTMESTDQEGGPSYCRKRKYNEEVGSIHWKDLKVAMQLSSFRYVNNCLAGRRSTVDELCEPLDENESDRDQMMRLSSYVMTEYDDRLREVEWYKAKFKKNKQLKNDARKTSKPLADAIRLKDENFETTKEQLETTIIEVSKVKGELYSALVEVSGLKMSIPTERDAAVQEFLGSQAFHDAFRPRCIRAANFEKRIWMAVLECYDNGSIIRKYRDEMDKYRQKGEAFILAVDPNSDDDSDNEASISEQSQESEDGPGDAEKCGDDDGVETQSDIVKGSASDEVDS
ncbi:hypothetical protein DVH24_041511 [Malus domestica]|uniref:Uncharacterized protein n=1 Tax=Malus domestica TaxID=3750 RepID=A0A498IE36_MALDO|nr:hypothetical protein DVH24_041511 [Malus domestica]